MRHYPPRYHADAVAITNTEHVLAYVGVGEINYRDNDDFISPTTRQAIRYGKIIIKNNDEAHRTPESTPCWSFRCGKKASSPAR
jgi:LytS/YehU family sensor histidine kinase